MKFEDKLKITQSQHDLPADIKHFCSITDHPITEVVEKLGAKGIHINPLLSEVRINYEMQGSTRKATVPFRTNFHDEDIVIIDAYYLRDQALEIRLENCHDIKPISPRNIIGGSVRGEIGIIAYLVYQGGGEGQEIIKRAKTVIDQIYNPFSRALESVEVSGTKETIQVRGKKK